MGDEQKQRRPGKPSLPDEEVQRILEAIEWLLKERFRNNKTDLARAAKLSQPAISQYLLRRMKPSAPAAKRIAALLGIDEAQLRRGEWRPGQDVPPPGTVIPLRVPTDPSYPNRAAAIAHAQALGYEQRNPTAFRRAKSELMSTRLQSMEDIEVYTWFQEFIEAFTRYSDPTRPQRRGVTFEDPE